MMNLKSNRGQSIVEYVVMFVAMMATVLIVFFGPGGFRPASNQEGERDNFFDRMRLRSAFDSAINTAIKEFKKQ